MRKAVGIWLLAGILLGVGAVPASAQMRKDVGVVKGKVTAVDRQKNEISVWDYSSKTVQSFLVDAVLIKSLQKDLEVLIFFKLGSKVATNVKVLASRIPQK